MKKNDVSLLLIDDPEFGNLPKDYFDGFLVKDNLYHALSLLVSMEHPLNIVEGFYYWEDSEYEHIKAFLSVLKNHLPYGIEEGDYVFLFAKNSLKLFKRNGFFKVIENPKS